MALAGAVTALGQSGLSGLPKELYEKMSGYVAAPVPDPEKAGDIFVFFLPLRSNLFPFFSVP